MTIKNWRGLAALTTAVTLGLGCSVIGTSVAFATETANETTTETGAETATEAPAPTEITTEAVTAPIESTVAPVEVPDTATPAVEAVSAQAAIAPITARAAAAVALTSPADGSTFDIRELVTEISGTGDEGATVVATVNGTALAPVTVASGAWTAALATIPVTGLNTIVLTQTALDGTVSTTNASYTMTVPDAAVVEPVAITYPANGSELSSLMQEVWAEGTGDNGATISVVLNGVASTTTTVVADGKWSVAMDQAYKVGENTLVVTQVTPGGVVRDTVSTFTMVAPQPGTLTIDNVKDGATFTVSNAPKVFTGTSSATGMYAYIETLPANNTAVQIDATLVDGKWTAALGEALTPGTYRFSVTHESKTEINTTSVTFTVTADAAGAGSGGSLAETGSANGWVAGSIATLVAAAGGTLLVTARRRAARA